MTSVVRGRSPARIQLEQLQSEEGLIPGAIKGDERGWEGHMAGDTCRLVESARLEPLIIARDMTGEEGEACPHRPQGEGAVRTVLCVCVCACVRVCVQVYVCTCQVVCRVRVFCVKTLCTSECV